MTLEEELEKLKDDYDDLYEKLSEKEQEVEAANKKIEELEEVIQNARGIFDDIASSCADILRQTR